MRKIRFTIGGLMAVVLVLAIGFAALRNANETWSGVMTLATYGALGVAILGIVFRKGAQRAWWLGFFVFGWGFLCVAPHLSSWSTRRPPTLALLEWLRTKSGGQPGPPNSFAAEAFLFSNIAHCLWASWPPSWGACWPGPSSFRAVLVPKIRKSHPIGRTGRS